MTIEQFLNEVNAKYAAGDATEHSYRAPLENLFRGLDDEVRVINEAQRVRQVGSPDFTFKRKQPTGGKGLTIGICECKDVGGIGLDARERLTFNKDPRSKEQFERYLEAFANLLYTDGWTWVFFKDHDPKPSCEPIVICEEMMGLKTYPERFPELQARLQEFVAETPKSITTSKDLATRMAAKAKLIRFVFQNALRGDEEFRSELGQQFTVFKDRLIHDLTPDDFAGIYAETITYGLFAARLQDVNTPQDFSRAEAYELLPRSNPFLKDLFQFIARRDLDEGLVRVIDDLVEIFLVSHPWEIMQNYGKSTARNDPFLHFYEDFLAAYDKKKRKARGVWYTPEPVVDFIIRAVDDVLKSEFGLPLGLADTSKITVAVPDQADLSQKRRRKEAKPTYKDEEVHRVQILDPAAGTGTFLAHAIKHIADTVKTEVGPGAWQGYVEKDLIPRLHGFELLMASYAMCHLKLDMELRATGYQPSNDPPRASVYLTNSLEEGEPPQPVLMLERWLAEEAIEANRIKTEKPIMCVIGNPPYLGEGGKSEGWLGELMDAYKKEPGGKQKLQERNSKLLNDLYVKFIRLSEHMIEKNGEGVLGFITNHGYIDNVTFRGMRWHLLKTFDKIYVLDLHGNAKKSEIAPNGSADKNVFDIQQGVAIIIGVKKRGEKTEGELAQVFHGDLWGARKAKYERLLCDTRTDLFPSALKDRVEPFFFLNDFNQSSWQSYSVSPSVRDIFIETNTGVKTHRDSFVIDQNKKDLSERIKLFFDASRSNEEVTRLFGVNSTSAWDMEACRKSGEFQAERFASIHYRPFDKRSIYYDIEMIDRDRYSTMRHLLWRENICLLSPRMTSDSFAVLASEDIPSNKTASRYDQSYCFPLYLYPDEDELDQTRRVNFDPKLYAKMRGLAGLGEESDAAAEAVFDYIYGVLHCPAYRETYAEFLKIDFPRIPWPSGPDMFEHIRTKGNMLRRLHLMEPDAIGEAHYPLHGAGDNTIAAGYPKYERGRVYINEDQYFDGAPEVSWSFWIGGYQPAQKWLKDRRGRALSTEDLIHYQRVLKILSETDRIMKTIEMDL
ncbi:MAG: type ISP restriction/modification enzyme [Pseudomonadota bacterium]